MVAYLEHANITVPDIDAAIAFLKVIEPEFKVRHDATPHGVNHLAWVVGDFAAVCKRLEQSGYRKGIPVDAHPYRKRAYYFDTAGFEWEVVGYLTEDPIKRNAYD